MSSSKTKDSRHRVRKKAAATAKRRSPEANRLAGMDPKLAAFIRKHWPAKGSTERIARAEKAWKEAVEIASAFKNVDDETWRLIAQSKELEDL